MASSMFILSAISILSFIHFSLAQNTPTSPECAQSCLTDAAGEQPCADYDTACQCLHESAIRSFTIECLTSEETCTAADVERATSYYGELCQALGFPTDATSVAGGQTNIATATIASATEEPPSQTSSMTDDTAAAISSTPSTNPEPETDGEDEGGENEGEDNSNENGQHYLSIPAISGIAAGSAFVVASIITGIIYCYIRRKNQKQSQLQDTERSHLNPPPPQRPPLPDKKATSDDYAAYAIYNIGTARTTATPSPPPPSPGPTLTNGSINGEQQYRSTKSNDSLDSGSVATYYYIDRTNENSDEQNEPYRNSQNQFLTPTHSKSSSRSQSSSHSRSLSRSQINSDGSVPPRSTSFRVNKSVRTPLGPQSFSSPHTYKINNDNTHTSHLLPEPSGNSYNQNCDIYNAISDRDSQPPPPPPPKPLYPSNQQILLQPSPEHPPPLPTHFQPDLPLESQRFNFDFEPVPLPQQSTTEYLHPQPQSHLHPHVSRLEMNILSPRLARSTLTRSTALDWGGLDWDLGWYYDRMKDGEGKGDGTPF